MQIDTGTDNAGLLADPAYIGDRQNRVRGTRYDELIEEFINASKEIYGSNVLFHVGDVLLTLIFSLFIYFMISLKTLANRMLKDCLIIIASIRIASMTIFKELQVLSLQGC